MESTASPRSLLGSTGGGASNLGGVRGLSGAFVEFSKPPSQKEAVPETLSFIMERRDSKDRQAGQQISTSAGTWHRQRLLKLRARPQSGAAAVLVSRSNTIVGDFNRSADRTHLPPRVVAMLRRRFPSSSTALAGLTWTNDDRAETALP